jgi:hypothetical protein
MDKTEDFVKKEIQCLAPVFGITLLRNNSGMCMNPKGVPVRFGLGNKSAQSNRVLKSSDLIGIWAPKGIFVAIECKRPGWVFKGDDREIAQLTFINLVREKGGLGCFATCWDDVQREIENFSN